MPIKLSFFGAAGNVTGAKYLLEAGGRRLLVDCGLYQERALQERNWAAFPFEAAALDAVLLTHAHLDHCGLLPRLHRAGFRGRILCTDATAEIAKIVLLDSARLQAEDVAYKQRRHAQKGRTSPYPYEPLYTVEDAERAAALFSPLRYDAPVDLGGGVSCAFREAGHILGSASLAVTARNGGGERRIVFSGDLGRPGMPILRDPAPIGAADYVLVESTYGNRVHKPSERIPDTLARVINQTVRAGGNVVVPSFATERAQDLLYHMHLLLRQQRIPRLRVFLDSPMAVRVTEVFKRHPELLDAETAAMLQRGEHPCDFPGLTLCRTADESKAIQAEKAPCVVIAGSGMCTGGRIKHHLKANIGRRESTILFVGYQAAGTLGRLLLDGLEEVRIHGEMRRVEARIEKVNGFSAHADRNELWDWLAGTGRPPRQAFVVHGEPEAAGEFAALLRSRAGWRATAPGYGDVAELD
jgi:metallo-beta-lactamase family protein